MPGSDPPGHPGRTIVVAFIVRRVITAVADARHCQRGHLRDLLSLPRARADPRRHGARVTWGGTPPRGDPGRDQANAPGRPDPTCSTGTSSRASSSAEDYSLGPKKATARHPASASPSTTTSRSGRRFSTACPRRCRWPSAPRRLADQRGRHRCHLRAETRHVTRPDGDDGGARGRVTADLLHRPGLALGVRLHAGHLPRRRQLHPHHPESGHVVPVAHPALDHSGVPLRRALRPSHQGGHAGDHE